MKYDVVFEGGGAKGAVFAGALQEFEARGHTIGRLLGTSAGAITAAALAAGYNSQELLQALVERRDGKPIFTTFMATPGPFSQEEIANSAMQAFLRAITLPLLPGFIKNVLFRALWGALMRQPAYRHMFSFEEKGGWYSADGFLAWFRHKLDSGLFQGHPRHFSHMNLTQFHEATGCELSLVAADTSDNAILVLNHRTAPDCPLVWAARMSMSVPLLWQEVEWRPDWGTYRGRDMNGHTVVDGGLLSNLPIELFLSTRPHVTALMGPKTDAAVLGFLIDERLPVPGADSFPRPPRSNLLFQSRTAQRLLALVDTMTQAHDKMVIDAFEHLVCRLPAQGYGTTEFDMSEGRQQALLAAGRQATAAYFDRMEEEEIAAATQPGTTVSTLLQAEAAAQADGIATNILEP
jgi:NTE family protein